MSNAHSTLRRPNIPRLVRVMSVPIILIWVLFAVALSILSPPLETVAEQHAVPLSPRDSEAFQAMMRIGAVFKEFHSDSAAMIVLEGKDKLSEGAHEFYNHIVAKLKSDHTHVENVQDFWSDPLTAAGSQSVDGKAAYVQVFLVGAQDTTPSHESIAAVRDLVDSVPAPPGVKAYVAGNTVLNADMMRRRAQERGEDGAIVDRRHPGDVADRLPLHRDHDPGSADRRHRTLYRTRSYGCGG